MHVVFFFPSLSAVDVHLFVELLHRLLAGLHGVERVNRDVGVLQRHHLRFERQAAALNLLNLRLVGLLSLEVRHCASLVLERQLLLCFVELQRRVSRRLASAAALRTSVSAFFCRKISRCTEAKKKKKVSQKKKSFFFPLLSARARSSGSTHLLHHRDAVAELGQ